MKTTGRLLSVKIRTGLSSRTSARKRAICSKLVPKPVDDTWAAKVETLTRIGGIAQVGDRAFVDQARVTRVGILRAQVPLTIVLLVRVIVAVARRDPAQGVDRYTELVLQTR